MVRKKSKSEEKLFTFAHVGAKRYAFNVNYYIKDKACVVTNVIPVVNQSPYPLRQAIDNIGGDILKAKLKKELGRFTAYPVVDFSFHALQAFAEPK